MKTTAIIPSLALCCALSASAQGVIIGPGQTFSFGFDKVDNCFFDFEELSIAYARVGFGNDRFEPGESLRIEMFENSLNDSPFAAQTYSATSSVTSVAIYGPSLHWGDYQGLIRISMLSGSVDVTDGFFIASPSPRFLCPVTVLVPEPNIATLAMLGSAVVWIYRRRKRNMSATSQGRKTRH